MRKDSFQEAYPGYTLIPEKRKLPAFAVGALSLLVLAILIGTPLYFLTRYNAPVPVQAGYNDLSLGTLKNTALQQQREGRQAEAAASFANYFRLGGREPEIMAAYASTLDALGHTQQALQWSRSAVERAPESKAARLTRDTLEEKNRGR